MYIKGLVDEDFTNYKKPSMFIAMPNCSFKCEKECGVRCCQNSDLAKAAATETDVASLVRRYLGNNITSAVIFGGLEPFDDFGDVKAFIDRLRKSMCDDDVVIYTGYNEDEIGDMIDDLRQYKNIIIKFGRYIPFQTGHYDALLRVNLASDNQYAKQIS